MKIRVQAQFIFNAFVKTRMVLNFRSDGKAGGYFCFNVFVIDISLMFASVLFYG